MPEGGRRGRLAVVLGSLRFRITGIATLATLAVLTVGGLSLAHCTAAR